MNFSATAMFSISRPWSSARELEILALGNVSGAPGDFETGALCGSMQRTAMWRSSGEGILLETNGADSVNAEVGMAYAWGMPRFGIDDGAASEEDVGAAARESDVGRTRTPGPS